MPAPATAAEFADLVKKSQLVRGPALDRVLGGQGSVAVLPGTPDGLAGRLVGDGLLTRFQADLLLQGKFRGFFIGPYKALDLIGSGGMGTVYLCQHRRMGHRAAVKVLRTANALDPVARGRFLREARAVAALDHPNIVRAYDAGHDDRLHYLVMEYVEGRTLRQLVAEHGRLREARAAGYLRQAALGLQHAHERGLVHRDIKPSNLMVDRDGVVKILDYGLARFSDGADGDLTRGAVLGSEDYMALEQLIDSHEVDIRADIYSLGATLSFCLTGKAPPRAGVPTPEGGPRAPADLYDVLRKMMAQEPEHRYQTPAEVAEAAARWVPGAAPRARKRPARRPAARAARPAPPVKPSSASAAAPEKLPAEAPPAPLPCAAVSAGPGFWFAVAGAVLAVATLFTLTW